MKYSTVNESDLSNVEQLINSISCKSEKIDVLVHSLNQYILASAIPTSLQKDAEELLAILQVVRQQYNELKPELYGEVKKIFDGYRELFLNISHSCKSDSDYEYDFCIRKSTTCDKELIIPEGVIGIEANAFIGNEYIERVVFPSSLEYIASGAFCACTKLKSIEFQKSIHSKKLDYIGPMAFGGTSIEKVSNLYVERINNHAFAEMPLKEIDISCNEIEEEAFVASFPQKLKISNAHIINFTKLFDTFAGFADFPERIDISDSVWEIQVNLDDFTLFDAKEYKDSKKSVFVSKIPKFISRHKLRFIRNNIKKHFINQCFKIQCKKCLYELSINNYKKNKFDEFVCPNCGETRFFDKNS